MLYSIGNINRILRGFAPSLAGRFELVVLRGEDLCFTDDQPVGRGDAPDRKVKPHVVEMRDKQPDEALCFIEPMQHERPLATQLDFAVPAFDLTIALRIAGTGADMAHAGESDELETVAGDGL